MPDDPRLRAIDHALGEMSEDLAAKYPSVALSRASLLRRRDQILAASRPRSNLSFIVGSGVFIGNPDADLWRHVADASDLFASSYRVVFAAVNASAASATPPVWRNEDVDVLTSWGSEDTAVACWAIPV